MDRPKPLQSVTLSQKPLMRLQNPNTELRHTNPNLNINPSRNISPNPNTSPSPSISPSLNLPTNLGDHLTSQNHNINRNLGPGPNISLNQNTNPNPVTSQRHPTNLSPRTNLKPQHMRKKRMSMGPHKLQPTKSLRSHMKSRRHLMSRQP